MQINAKFYELSVFQSYWYMLTDTNIKNTTDKNSGPHVFLPLKLGLIISCSNTCFLSTFPKVRLWHVKPYSLSVIFLGITFSFY